MTVEIISSDANELLDKISSRFDAELTKMSCEVAKGDLVTTKDVWTALSLILNSRPDWATT